MVSKKYIVLFVLIIIFLLGVSLYPVRVDCKVPWYTCITAPDENGFIYIQYDIEPYIIKLIEKVTCKDSLYKYKSDTEKQLTRLIRDPGANITPDDLGLVMTYQDMVYKFGEPDSKKIGNGYFYTYSQEDGSVVTFYNDDRNTIRNVFREDWYGNREIWIGEDNRTLKTLINGEFLVGTDRSIARHENLDNDSEALLEDPKYIGKLYIRDGKYEFIHSGNKNEIFNDCDFVVHPDGFVKISFSQGLNENTLFAELDKDVNIGSIKFESSAEGTVETIVDSTIEMEIFFNSSINCVQLNFLSERNRECIVFRSTENSSYQ